MADTSTNNYVDDPLFPYLCSIKKSHSELKSNAKARETLDTLLINCVTEFKDDERYQDDIRFLKIWLLFADSVQDFDTIYETLEEKSSCLSFALLYKTYACYLEIKGKVVEADRVYQLGISRNAMPIEEMERAYVEFLKRMTIVANGIQHQKSDIIENEKTQKEGVNPWSLDTINKLLKKMPIMKYNGYYTSAKNYPGKVPLSSLQNSVRNKMIEIGGKKYQIKGCAGKGGFAQVFKACSNNDPDDIVALKIQNPPFPWEFYIYRQLDNRVLDPERSSFSSASRIHVYSDYSILVCDFIAHGTLQDAINSYLVTGKKMHEALCVYYTLEMFRMLETLHGVGIIHGDFKPDNLLIRYSKDDLTTEGFSTRSGPWLEQGLCLIDWGRAIDLTLFPEDVEFTGDCRTSGFRCIEIQEKRPWKYQVDTYGLCVIIHMMLHGSYMEIEKVLTDGRCVYQPKNKTLVRRYYNVELWEKVFSRLLNVDLGENHMEVMKSLRLEFEEYLSSNPQLVKKLTELLLKQRASLCGN